MADYYDQVLDLLKQGESGGKNIKNYRYDPTHTAQGYWQITNSTWGESAPKVGIDTSKYPNAMSMEEDDQRKVARHILINSGIGNWEYAKTPEFREKLKGLTMPQDQSYDNMSLEDLQKLSKQLHGQLDSLKAPDKPPADKKGNVKAPEQGWLERAGRWAEDVQGSGYGVIPAMRMGAKVFSDPDWRDKASDVLEGAGEMAPLATASSVAAAPFTGGLSTVPMVLTRNALGWGGSKLASYIADQAGGDLEPKTRRLVTDLAGLGGGIVGYGKGPETVGGGAKLAYKATTSKTGRGIIGGAAAHALGLPPWMGYFAGRDTVRGGDYGTKGKGSPATGKVDSPAAKPLPKTAVEDDMLRTGTLTPEQHTQRMMDLGMDENMARAKTAHAQKTHLEDAAKEAAKNAPPQPRSPVTLKPAPVSTATPTSGTPTNVRTLPGVQAVPNLPVGPPPIGPAASGTGPGLQITPASAPPQPPAPGSMGTVGPLPPTPQGPPLQGPAATQTPIVKPLGQPPSPTAPVNLGTVGPLGQMPPRPPISTTVPKMTPLGEMPGPSLSQKAIAIADAAEKIGRAPSIVMNKATRAKWIKELGFDPSSEEISEGRRVYKERERAKQPTAKNP